MSAERTERVFLKEQNTLFDAVTSLAEMKYSKKVKNAALSKNKRQFGPDSCRDQAGRISGTDD